MPFSQIVGIGYCVPGYGSCSHLGRCWTNRELIREKKINSTDEDTKRLSGISQRYYANQGVRVVELARIASLQALKMARLEPKDLSGIKLATVTEEERFPAVATQLQLALGIKYQRQEVVHNFASDIKAGCAGFTAALNDADNYIKVGQWSKVLVVGVEILSKLINFRDRGTCMLFGDGAGAVVVQAVKSENDSGILANYSGSDGGGGSLLTTENGLIYMEGHPIYQHAITRMVQSVQQVLQKTGLTAEQVTWLLPHQANLRIMQAVAKKCGIPIKRVMINIDQIGNTSAASIPICLGQYYEQGRVKKNDIIVLTSFGAGFSFGATVIRWTI